MLGSLTLTYRRDGGEASTGSFSLAHGDDVQHLEAFARLSFFDMMKKLAGHIQANPEVVVFIQRNDRPGLAPVQLSADEVELFRTDPVTAIKLRTFPPQVVHIGAEKRGEDRPVPLLDAGYTTIVECFGNWVYARTKKKSGGCHIECPFCGTWTPITVDHAINCECGHSTGIFDDKRSIGWAGLSVSELLNTSAEKYFLPRRWNKYGNWITREALEALYAKYLKEKNECTPNV